CVDEITHMSPEQARNLAFGSSQKGGRDVMKQNGEPKPKRGGYKATMILTSANSSLHNLLSIDNNAGTAGNMRVFEMIFPKLDTSWAAGTEFLHELNRN